MSLERVDPDTLYPAHGFAHAVVASGSRTIYVGGQVASNLTGEILAADDYEKQSDIALRNFALLNMLALLSVAWNILKLEDDMPLPNHYAVTLKVADILVRKA